MIKKSRLILYANTGGVFLVFDQLLKYLARTNKDFNFYFYKNWIGWEYLANNGIAFSLPVPNWLLIIITPFILLFLGWLLTREKKNKHYIYLGIFLIISGAVSNFIDRVVYGVTIDYIRIFTSVINLADVFIVVGAGVWLWASFSADEKVKEVR